MSTPVLAKTNRKQESFSPPERPAVTAFLSTKPTERLLLLLFTLLAFTLSGCVTTVRRAARSVVVTKMDDVLPADQNERSLWLSTHIDTEESKFGSQTTRKWKRNYEVFSQALLEKADSSGFDSASLSKILQLILAEAEGQQLAYIPIAAYTTQLNGEPVWIVVAHWEMFFGLGDPIRVRQLSHVRTYAFTQKNPKQVAFLTCR